MIGIMCLYSFTSAVLVMFRWTQISELQLQPQPYPILWKCWWASSDKVPPSVKSQHRNRMLEKACMNEIRFSQNKLQLKTTTQGSERGEWLDILFHFVVWPFASLTPLDTFSVFFFFFVLFLLHVHAFHKTQLWKVMVVFNSGGKAKQFLCNPLPNTKAEWKAAWKQWIQTGRDGWSIGRATLTNVWHHLTYWMAFLCQDTEREGGRETACFRLRLEQTWSLCRHTPPHTSRNCARKQINKPRLTSHTLYQVAKLKKKTNHKVFFENKEKLDWWNLQNNVDNYKMGAQEASLGLL